MPSSSPAPTPFITLTHPAALSDGEASAALTLALPPTLLWVDQYAWAQVVAQHTHTSTGALLIDTWAKQAGRPITLKGEQDRAWCERITLQTLREWASEPGLVLTLALSYIATPLQVVFDHSQGAPIEAAPLSDVLSAGGPALYSSYDAATGALLADVEVDYADPRPTDPFAITLKFVQVG